MQRSRCPQCPPCSSRGIRRGSERRSSLLAACSCQDGKARRLPPALAQRLPSLRCLGWQSLPSGKPAILVLLQPTACLSLEEQPVCVPRKRGARPAAWARRSGQGPAGWGGCPELGGWPRPPSSSSGGGVWGHVHLPDLNRWPLFQCPTSLGSAPLRVLENVQRKQEAARPVQGTGLGWFVSPGLTLRPKDYFPQAVTRQAEICCPFKRSVLIFANGDTHTSGRGRLCRSIFRSWRQCPALLAPVPAFNPASPARRGLAATVPAWFCLRPAPGCPSWGKSLRGEGSCVHLTRSFVWLLQPPTVPAVSDSDAGRFLGLLW